jgi:hypothetical protein
VELHEGHEGTRPDRTRTGATGQEMPVGDLHAVRPGGDVSLCTENDPAPLRVTDSGKSWKPTLNGACRRCRELAPKEEPRPAG